MPPSLFIELALGVALFATTNIDDILLLSAFFADSHLRPRSIVFGQFLGIGVLTAVSIVAAVAALAVPENWIAWSGLVPLGLGIRKLWQLRNEGRETNGESDRLRDSEHRAEKHTRSQILAVAAVTIANGGDNLGVYIPVFANKPASIPIYVAVFAVMTALWCAAGHALVNNRLAGQHVQRFGHLLLPFVLMALGAWILSGVFGTS